MRFDRDFDSVECVMALEDAFEISIPDQDAKRLESIGDLCDYVAARKEARKSTDVPCPSAAAFYEIRRELSSTTVHLPIPVRPTTPVADLLGPGDIREQWRQLGSRLNLRLPSLTFSSATVTILFLLWVTSWMTTGMIAFKSAGIAAAICCGGFTCLASTIILVVSAYWAAKLWGKTIPQRAQTAGDLAHLNLIQRRKESPVGWTETEIYAVVRYIVARNLALPIRRIGRDTRFDEFTAVVV